jgi:5-methyltetrahydrofolate--homocysteine methyltransferase
MTTLLRGSGSAIEIDPVGPVRLIGERINPSGKKRLHQALTERDWDYVVGQAIEQVEAGADLIDVNVGGKGLEEAALLPLAVKAVSESVDVPLCIDTRMPSALEAALEVCPGRPLVNSIGGEEKALAECLPLIADRGAAVIVLCMGQDGIPSSAEERLKIAEYVCSEAAKAGIDEQDIFFDPLVMTVGADDQAARVALETIRLLRVTFPRSNITGGASNISFGMPGRKAINAHFLTAAATMGMNIPIADPTDAATRSALKLADIFLGRDERVKAYMRHYRSNLTKRGNE